MAVSTSSEHDYQQVLRFCIDFQALLKTVEIYTIEHVGSLEAAVRLMGSFRPMAADTDTVSINPGKKALQVGAIHLPLKMVKNNQAIARVFQIFSERDIKLIAIKPDVTSEDFLLMAKTLTAPFEPIVAERQYEELNLKTGSRVIISSKTASIGMKEGKMLPLLLSGKLPRALDKSTRNSLFWEITHNVGSSAWAIQKQLKWESQKDSPIGVRDTLTKESDRWVHILGEVMERVHADGDTSSADGQREILKLMMPYLASIHVDSRSDEFDNLMNRMDAANVRETITIFAHYYERILKRAEDLETYRQRVERLMKQLEQFVHAEKSEKKELIPSVKSELAAVASAAVTLPIIMEKLNYQVLITNEPELIQPMFFIFLDGFTDQNNIPKYVIDSFSEQVRAFCKKFGDYCESTITGFLKIISDMPPDNQPENLIRIVRETLNTFCGNCPKIKKCSIIETLSKELSRQVLAHPIAYAFLELWQQLAHLFLENDFNAFIAYIVPLAENELSPDRFKDENFQDAIIEAWKSFSGATYFKYLFKRLTESEKQIRFNTIDMISKWGAFAVWLCLGGLTHQSWQLRRNLATIIGRVASLDKPVFLKQVLRDRDWRVRYEVISAIHQRVNEIADQIKNDNDHPLGKIMILALLDGRKQIREEAYAMFELIAPPESVRALINAYNRLSTVGDDYEIDERSKILVLLAGVTKHNLEYADEVIGFISGIAAMKEGILTPQWMVPLKKASVEALEKIDSAGSWDWIQTLAKKRPYKYGVVGREARAALKRGEPKPVQSS
ncbi:MAG: hypothetical protein WBM02_06395 [bacterium]